MICELTHLSGKHRLVADKNSEVYVSSLERRSRRSRLEFSDLFRQSSRKSKQLRKRKIFSKWDEVNLVVPRSPIARGTDERGRIEHFRSRRAAVHCGNIPYRASHYPAVCVTRHLAHRLSK